ncbi:MAG: hypothetical protein ACK5RL_01090 [Acidimicrobiales bacterium]
MDRDKGYDFSDRTIPQSWHYAAKEAPHADAPAPKKKDRRRPVPARTTADLFSAIVFGGAVSAVTGAGWYLAETVLDVHSPLAPILVGVLIGLGVRFSAGPHDPGARGTLALVFYLLTTSVVVFLLSQGVAQTTSASAGFERRLLGTRFGSPVPIFMWVVGAVVSVQINSLLRGRR